LVHRGTSTTMFRTVLDSSAKRGMSLRGGDGGHISEMMR
jgi:hypothetical protein